MSQIPPIFKREFLGYFRSPVAYVFLIVFLMASVGCAFFLGGFFDANIASLESYFTFLPWLFIAFVPAAGMRLWSEERRVRHDRAAVHAARSPPLEAVLGKFLAAWAFLCLAVLLSFPMALTVAYLGDPDWGVLARRLPRQHAHGRRLPGHLLAHVGVHQEPGHQLRDQRVCLLPPRAARLERVHRFSRRLPGAARPGSWTSCRISASRRISTPSSRASSIRRT